MAENSKIAWTQGMRQDGNIIPGYTFNPWWGCVKVSQGCRECYAATFAKRTGHSVWGVDAPRRFFGAKHWDEPYKWAIEAEKAKERRKVFVGSMCDWAETHRNPGIQDEMNKAREKLGYLIKTTPMIDYLLLTKRIEDAGAYLAMMFYGSTPPNVWIGTTCEDQEMADERIPHLLRIDAKVLFISVEPQIGPVNLGLLGTIPASISPRYSGVYERIHWVIVGGESGAKCRPFDLSWARSLRDECKKAGVAFFMKQLGGFPNKRDGLEDFPPDLQIRQYPS